MGDVEIKSREKVKRLLKELFQFDMQDLDFGIYRIMNFKRKQIQKFIEDDLINAAEEEFREYARVGIADLQKEIEGLRAEIIRDFGEGTIDEQGNVKKHEDAPKIQEYLSKMKELIGAKLTQPQIDDVFNHVYEFFSRYYDKGDFLSKRRYGGREKYYVPYNGEEVLLNWANNDQYYVKSGEYFRKYSFKVGEYRVNFVLREVEAESNNVKDKPKYFLVCDEDFFKIDEENKELDIFFNWRTLVDEEKKNYRSRNVQEIITLDAANRLLSEIGDRRPGIELRRKVNEQGESFLAKHLKKYVEKNTTDYFVHKNLKPFLERELDFYIKNEVLDLDDIESMDERRIRLNKAKMRSIRQISKKVIEFLAQIENFQKKIWEKGKFVIKTEYIVTLDKIKTYCGEEFLQSILDDVLKNKDQLKEWEDLFRIKIKDRKDLVEISLQGKNWKKLPIDTKYFGQEFKTKLIAKLSEGNCFDAILDGILIKSENWQALNTVLNKWQEKIQCIYIDAPYNTGNDEFLYKDNYRHSSWLTMMCNRLEIAKKFLRKSGVIFVSIDDNEATNLDELLQTLFGEKNFVGKFVILSNPRGRYLEKHVATCHEYVLLYAKDSTNLELKGVRLTEKQIKEYKFSDKSGKYRLLGLRKRGAYSRKEDRPNLHFPIYYDPSTDEILLKRRDSAIKIIPKLSDGSDGVWRWSKEKIEKDKHLLIVRQTRDRYDVFQKDYLTEDKTLKPRTIWTEKSLNYERGKEVLKDLFGFSPYRYPKPVGLLKKIIDVSTNSDDVIMDFFAGSGTTAHAVLKLNREGNGERKFILVDMAEYFDTVLVPRIKKVAFSFNWKDGKPEDIGGSGGFFKYHYFEQYEDALENIRFEQKTLPEFEDYFIKYVLDFETKQSSTFLNIDEMADPFNYKLRVIENYEPRTVNVDMVETFNYLFGFNVAKMCTFNDGQRLYYVLFGKHNNRNTVIIWRNTKDLNLTRDKKFIEEKVLSGHSYDFIFVNGDSYVKNARAIEPEFKKLMVA